MSDQEELKKPLDLNTDIQNVSSCERRIKVTIARPEVDRYFQSEYAELEKTAYVPGFRVGKAPRKLVERRFRKDVVDRVKSSLVIDALAQVNDSSDFTPISEPDFDLATLIIPEDGNFVFEFAIEVRPEFDLPEWKGLKIEKPVRDFSDDDVNKAVKRVLGQFANLEETSEPIAIGDIITFDAIVKSGDTVLSEAKDDACEVRQTLTFHDGTVPDFGERMTGIKVGETVTMNVTLSDDAPNTEYQGKTVELSFTIRKVSKVVLPELTKDFLERIGGFETEADFRDTVLDSLKRQLEHEQHRRARLSITDSLTVAATWGLPPTLLKRQSEREFRRTVMELQRSGYNQDEIVAQLNVIRQNSAAATAQALKEHFILEKIAEVENVVDTPDDYDVEVALIAAQSGQSPRRVRAKIEKSGEMDILRNQIIERKVIAMINEQAKFVEVPFEWGQQDSDSVEAFDWAAGGNPEAIAAVSQDDLKAVHQEIDQKKRLDPNVKVK